jgi:hypothetical protein
MGVKTEGDWAARRRRMNRGRPGLEISAAALMMLWPAIFNGYPILYPDAMMYMHDGLLAARALFLHQYSAHYGTRSNVYGLSIVPLHWNASAWPIVVVNALLLAWVILLVVRSVLLGRTSRYYLGLLALLSLLTGMSWYVSLPTPDILGPMLYLAIYLLVFVPEGLSRTERWALYLDSGWGIASHSSHLLVAAGLWLGLVSLMKRPTPMQRRGLAQVAGVIVVAVGVQVAVNWALIGRPALNPDRAPFLMARVVADGPGRWYLQQHCGDRHWAICEDVGRLPDSAEDFLWFQAGLWTGAPESKRLRLQQEEMPLVEATLRAYPWAELRFNTIAIRRQLLRSFGLMELSLNPALITDFYMVLPGERSRYLATRQAQDRLPLRLFSTIQAWMVGMSLAILGWFGWMRLRHKRAGLRSVPGGRLAGLALVLGLAVVGNAVVCATLSTVSQRLGGRVIWLVPLVAGLMAATLTEEWRDRRNALRAERAAQAV